jgi:hypothetical protein
MKSKTLPERLQEIQNIYIQLDGFGIPQDHEGILRFKQVANEFVKYGTSYTERIPLRGFKRTLVCTLSNQPHIPCTVLLKYTEHI